MRGHARGSEPSRLSAPSCRAYSHNGSRMCLFFVRLTQSFGEAFHLRRLSPSVNPAQYSQYRRMHQTVSYHGGAAQGSDERNRMLPFSVLQNRVRRFHDMQTGCIGERHILVWRSRSTSFGIVHILGLSAFGKAYHPSEERSVIPHIRGIG